MKVKVVDRIYDGTKVPIMVILTEKDKENIKRMLPSATKYCMYPETMTEDEARVWMKEKGE